MHFVMNFIGCVGTLMDATGLADILECAFGGVSHMLAGKRFPQNFRALRIVVEELLRGILQETDNPDDLMAMLQKRSDESKTTKLWVDNLLKPVLLMMLFCRAEKEADWALHLYAVEHMIPYFFFLLATQIMPAMGYITFAHLWQYHQKSWRDS